MENVTKVYKLHAPEWNITLGVSHSTEKEADSYRQSLKKILGSKFEIRPYWLVRNEYKQFLRYESIL